MSVIVTGMDIPKSCADCPVCHCKGKDDPWNYYCVTTMDDINIEEWDKERYTTCPLKSAEGLIEKIENYKVLPDYIYDYFAYNKAINDVTCLIKEYCEVS